MRTYWDWYNWAIIDQRDLHISAKLAELDMGLAFRS